MKRIVCNSHSNLICPKRLVWMLKESNNNTKCITASDGSGNNDKEKDDKGMTETLS